MLLPALLALTLSQPAAAEPPPDTRLYVGSLSIFRLGPLGLETQNRLMYQKRLMDSDSVLFENTFAAGGLSVKLNPAYVKVGPLVELQPIALLHLRLGYEYIAYFGGFGYLQSFPEPTSVYSFEKSVRDANEEAGLNYVTQGHHLFVEPTVQLKAGVVAIRSKTPIEYWSMGLENGDKVFYDATLHTLVPGQGLVVSNDSDLLYVSGKHLTAGLRYSGVFPQYGDGAFQAGAPSDEAISGNHHKLGPLVAWSFHNRDYQSSGLNKPTLLFVGGWYLDHPNAEESRSPYLLLGFGFSKDLLGDNG